MFVDGFSFWCAGFTNTTEIIMSIPIKENLIKEGNSNCNSRIKRLQCIIDQLTEWDIFIHNVKVFTVMLSLTKIIFLILSSAFFHYVCIEDIGTQDRYLGYK